ncbi:hypothetical protein [Rhizobium sp. IBUN]|nr:hypothetical protein [Rhizobium sp. IBUN]
MTVEQVRIDLFDYVTSEVAYTLNDADGPQQPRSMVDQIEEGD